MSTLDQFAQEKLDRLAQQNIRRTLETTRRTDGIRSERGGRTLISFCCNDYLNLSQHPRVKRAAIEAVEVYGAGAGASRLVTGNHPLYETLESRLAAFKGTEAACVFGSGYLANIGITPSLVGEDDLILVDALSHASTHAGIRLSRARAIAFDHNDVDHCRRLLREHRASYPRCMVMTEGVFSMDGDRAPLAALAALADEYDAWLMCDDAHAFGVLGGGRGSTHAVDPPVPVALNMGTLSKAVGAYGGYLCASRSVIDLIVTRSRSFIYTTGLPPAVIASCIAALDIIENDARLIAAPLAKAKLFTARLDLPAAESSIVPVVIGDTARAMDASSRLEEEGFLVAAIRPPTVKDGTARLRVTFTAGHDDGDVVRLAECIRDIRLGA